MTTAPAFLNPLLLRPPLVVWAVTVTLPGQNLTLNGQVLTLGGQNITQK